jgi:arylsulfatase A-like enzyme
MRNTLLAAGPAFKEGIESDHPCGIVDLAPTVLHCLDIERPSEWDGRPLVEALRQSGPPLPQEQEQTHSVRFAGGRQVLTLARAGGVSYPSRVDLVRDD